MSQQNERLTGVLLNGKNYISWARSITFSLSGRSKLEYITGDKKKPEPKVVNAPDETEKKAITEWQANDHLIMSWLLAFMELPIADLFYCTNSAKELWDKAEKLYGHKNNYAHIFQLQQNRHKIKQQNQSVTEILSQFQKT